jgi:hypothetical protein
MPKAVKAWEGIKNAQTWGPVCPIPQATSVFDGCSVPVTLIYLSCRSATANIAAARDPGQSKTLVNSRSVKHASLTQPFTFLRRAELPTLRLHKG